MTSAPSTQGLKHQNFRLSPSTGFHNVILPKPTAGENGSALSETSPISAIKFVAKMYATFSSYHEAGISWVKAVTSIEILEFLQTLGVVPMYSQPSSAAGYRMKEIAIPYAFLFPRLRKMSVETMKNELRRILMNEKTEHQIDSLSPHAVRVLLSRWYKRYVDYCTDSPRETLLKELKKRKVPEYVQTAIAPKTKLCISRMLVAFVILTDHCALESDSSNPSSPAESFGIASPSSVPSTPHSGKAIPPPAVSFSETSRFTPIIFPPIESSPRTFGKNTVPDLTQLPFIGRVCPAPTKMESLSAPNLTTAKFHRRKNSSRKVGPNSRVDPQYRKLFVSCSAYSPFASFNSTKSSSKAKASANNYTSAEQKKMEEDKRSASTVSSVASTTDRTKALKDGEVLLREIKKMSKQLKRKQKKRKKKKKKKKSKTKKRKSSVDNVKPKKTGNANIDVTITSRTGSQRRAQATFCKTQALQ
eukprot:TRINITY_DN1782_c0_g2_i2.p1 TRINITY_DN1782_c0_g2~~TRINITY_DN1782_c0_g2_i2.p1  ORF type:complete len:474 (+),score=64.00 TRINITY_DN1782_c0_g2_i2:75-1496(+)